MRVVPRSEIERIEAELELLPKLSAKQLDERRRELFGTARPPRLYGPLLIGVLAYRLQEKAFGGLKPATRRLLRQVAGLPAERRSLDRLTQPRLKAGAVLLREWHGTTQPVTVLESGYEYHGQRFNSLSEIARRITGNRWSGPLFFGLRTRPLENHHAAS
jgi:Protein of unknown function (DUF2924)